MHACVCTRAWMHACCEHYSCVCGCMSEEEVGAGVWGENVSEIFTYLFYIYCYFKCIFLSPCVKGKIKFLCFVYWWIIQIYLIWLICLLASVDVKQNYSHSWRHQLFPYHSNRKNEVESSGWLQVPRKCSVRRYIPLQGNQNARRTLETSGAGLREIVCKDR